MTTIDPAAEVQTTAAFPLPTPARFAVLRTRGTAPADQETVWYNASPGAVPTSDYDEALRVRNQAQASHGHAGYEYIVVSLNEAVQAYLDQNGDEVPQDAAFALPAIPLWMVLRTGNGPTVWTTNLDGTPFIGGQVGAEEQAARLTQDHGRNGYTYQPVNLNVLLRVWQNAQEPQTQSIVTAGQVRELEAQLQETRAARDEAMRTARRNVEVIQGALQELANEESTFDADAYHTLIETVNGRLSWEMDRLERQFTVYVSGYAEVRIPFSTTCSVTAANAEEAQQLVENDTSSYVDEGEIGDNLRYNTSGADLYNAWSGDWDFEEVTDVEEQ